MNYFLTVTHIGLLCLISGCDDSSGATGKQPRVKSAAIVSGPGSGTFRGKEKIDPAILIKYESARAEFMNAYKGISPAEKKAICDVSKLRLKGIAEEVMFPKTDGMKGSGSILYVSDKEYGGHRLIVKNIHSDAREFDLVMELLTREKAFMVAALGKAKVVPKVHEIETFKKDSGICYLSTMVSDFVGRNPLYLARSVLSSNAKLLGRVTARILEIMKEFHSTGFAHGDIHFHNFVYEGDADRIPETLSLIDFGRVEPFITKEGTHIPKAKGEYPLIINPKLLSDLELEGWIKTRRDDMFRIAEMILDLGNYDELFHKQIASLEAEFTRQGKMDSGEETLRRMRARILALKRERKIDPKAPKVFKRFYIYCMEKLGFAARPDYDYWIQEFLEINV